MNTDGNGDLQRNVDRIYQSIEEIHGSLSALEAQVRSGELTAHPEVNNTIENLSLDEIEMSVVGED